jgi:hypothetical protein
MGALLLIALVLAFGAGAQRLNSQVLYGSILGTVTDQSGAVVPGAKIILANPLTGLKREAETDGAGAYNIPNIPQGEYDISVTAAGFKPMALKGIDVTIGSIVRSDVTLEVGAATTEVTVTASAAALQTEKAEVSTKLTTVATQNLPLGFYRNYQFLQLLVPGAAESQGTTGALADTPERAIAVPINGLSPASNSTRIDGADSKFLWKPGGGALYVAPLESIQEVKITTNSFDPEKGMAGSAAIDVVTKSGTNQWHGVGFWYHFNQHFLSCEAFDYVCKSEALGLPPENKAKQISNNPGGNIGGPIKKDKLFFFANWDGFFERRTTNNYATVPTADMHTGDFSAYLENPVFLADGVTPVMVPVTDGLGNITGTTQLVQGMIFDPTTGNPDGTGRAVFAGNVIPQSRIDPIAAKILPLWPTGNAPLQFDAEGNIINNQFVQGPIKFDRNNLDFKVDWSRTDKHLAWFKYSMMRAVTDANCAYNDTFSPPCPGGEAGITNALVQTATVGHTWTLSPTFLVDGSIGYSRMGQDSQGIGFGENIGLDVLGIPGTNDPNDLRYSGAPRFTVGGYTAIQGAEGWQPLFRNDWSLTFSQNASWTRGKHTLRFGFDFIHHHLNHWQPESVEPRGAFDFNTGDATLLNLGGLDTDVDLFRNRYNQFATFLLGLWDGAGRSLQYVAMNGKSSEYAFYLSERWRATPKLTISAGLRYEYYPFMKRDSLGGGYVQYDPAANNVLLGGVGGNPTNLGVTTQKDLFAPRIGFAYQFRPNMVFRAGYASTFDTFPILRILRGTFPYDIGTRFDYDFSDPNFNNATGCSSPGNVDCAYLGLGTLSGGLPAIPVPDLSTGTVPIDPTVGIRYIAPGLLKRGRVETWNATLETKLPGDFLLGIGYVGNHMTGGWAQRNLHASLIDQQSPLSEQWGRTAETVALEGYLTSNYNALQVTIDRHFSRGFYLKGAYTWSKAIDLQSDSAWSGSTWSAPLFSGPGYLSHNRGMADFDHRHIFRMAFVWDVPYGAGRKWGANAPAIGRGILGGWQLNGIWSSQSGVPTGIYSDSSLLQTAGNWQTMDQVAPIKKVGVLGQEGQWYDPASFAIVPIESDGRQHRFGTAGRNIAVYGPGRWNFDASLFKHFKLTERFDLQFRAEGLNVFNHPYWNWDNSQWGNGFCWTDASGACGGGFLQSTTAAGHRTFRLGLRLSF